MRKRRMQSGYTLIDLVTTLAVAAILSSVGVQKYVDIHKDARTVAAASIASALGSASVNNFLLRSRGASSNTAAIANCSDASNLMDPGSMGTYSIESKPIAAGATESGSLQHLGQSTGATFVAYGTN